jgi:DegV family protein with EDD domain
MKNISIVTDTDASLSPETAQKYRIRQVPIAINFASEMFDSGTDIDDNALFARIEAEGNLPTTAAPSPGKFAEAYRQAFDEDEADEVLCFVVSGEISGTHDSALIAANELMPDKPITVVDTLSLSMGQGYMAVTAAEAVANGADLQQAVDQALAVRDRTYLFGALSTLKYLAMGGRVSHLTAEMAGLLNIKPILTIKEGKLDMLEKVRTRKKAWARVTDLVKHTAGSQPIERMSIIHVNALEDANNFEKLLRDSLDCPKEIDISDLSPGLSVHTGPGFVGVVFVLAE